MPDQWDPKSPWHDRRVRLAATHAIDRKALNQAETLGLSLPTGNIIPRVFEFAKVYEPPAYDAKKSKQLLAEAGFPNGFDAGELYPWPPYFSMGEAVAAYLQAVGIKTKIRTMGGVVRPRRAREEAEEPDHGTPAWRATRHPRRRRIHQQGRDLHCGHAEAETLPGRRGRPTKRCEALPTGSRRPGRP
jgi:hypothetical protein